MTTDEHGALYARIRELERQLREREADLLARIQDLERQVSATEERLFDAWKTHGEKRTDMLRILEQW